MSYIRRESKALCMYAVVMLDCYNANITHYFCGLFNILECLMKLATSISSTKIYITSGIQDTYDKAKQNLL